MHSKCGSNIVWQQGVAAVHNSACRQWHLEQLCVVKTTWYYVCARVRSTVCHSFTSAQCACALLNCPCHAVPSGSVLAVNCSRPSSGWPTPGWNLTVRGVGASTGCKANTSRVTVVTVNQPPVLSRNTSSSTVCALDRNVSLSYTLLSGGGATTAYNLSATPSNLNCTASPSATAGA